MRTNYVQRYLLSLLNAHDGGDAGHEVAPHFSYGRLDAGGNRGEKYLASRLIGINTIGSLGYRDSAMQFPTIGVLSHMAKRSAVWFPWAD